MKKEYINPEIQVVKMQQTQMLCSSLTDVMVLDDTPIDLFDDPTDDIEEVEDVW